MNHIRFLSVPLFADHISILTQQTHFKSIVEAIQLVPALLIGKAVRWLMFKWYVAESGMPGQGLGLKSR